MDFQMLNLLMKMMKSYAHEQIRSNGLNDTECMICSYVYSHDKCSQDDVCHALCMDKTTVTKSMQSLEGKKLLQRVSDINDRRRNVLSLTNEGKEKCSGILNIHKEWANRVLEELNEEEKMQFESYCNRLINAARKIQEDRENDER